ncbi:MAG: hypothetical protein ABS36_01025 [Acidobacteria bacterium SCN 69-37]|nr:MAG: hypothetical protein ABS36_01025 [Acidobacteria bacterium SCN 69-37]
MSSAPVARSRSWQTLLIGLLTVALVVLFLRDMNLRDAWDAVLHAHVGWLALAVVVTMQTYVLRAWRWRWLLRPLGPTRFRTAFRTTVMGFAASFLLPGRVGELLRPYALAKQEGLNPPAAMATIVVERVLDLCTVLVLFAIAILVAGIAVPREIATAGMLGAAAAIVGVLVLFVLAGHPERIGRWAGWITGFLPARMAATADHLVQTFVGGLRIMRSPKDLAWSIVWSVPLWLSIALGIVVTTWAFGLPMSFTGSFLVVGYLTVGVAVPTPGAAGGFHFFYKMALTQLFGAPDSAAGAAAIVLHLVTFVPVTALGLLYMGQDGLTLGQVKSVGAEAAAGGSRIPATSEQEEARLS